ncbi:MAG: N-6 DNA methylase [Salinivirgaceae bacterium]|nr:N-6 DNA methylase [Salinivirgaceae bacterium]
MRFKEHTKEESLQLITELVETFRRNEKTYKSLAYDEANTRTDFIDKFFEALNWDVRNDNARAERYRYVVREDKIQIKGQTKAPDYSFRDGGNRVFFVEAKKPSVNIKDDIDPAFQLRRYAYTAKLPISILTDFEEFAIYETNKMPKLNDKASDYRIKFITYDKYIENFDFLWNTISFNAVMNGDFDRFCEGKSGKRGTSEIDSKLLETIEDWRVKLAKNIALRNPDLSRRNLNSAVQKIIDRIIFLQIAEDKDIEEMETLLNASKRENAYSALRQVFDRANEKYNSGLFANEKWLDNLVVDDKVLSDIISELYYPKCPYAWFVLPVEILGNIYEKFLGSEIKFRNVKGGHTAVVEEKPEVKKAGGVYYTPRYIVDYIVRQTVGRKLEDKTPDKIKKLTICDPACGSGSFLVGAYKYLMDWYLTKYSENDEALAKAKKQGNVVETSNGLSLSLTEKQRILTTHIYGVDIDAQAVEVTKLSLFLQMLEGEGKQYVNRSMLLFRDSDLHVLPNLGDNIKCGNSLIGSDYISQELNLFDDEAIYKINPFDWDKQFSQIFKDGGFECVICNPPYVAVDLMSDNDKAYYKAHYPCFIKRGDLFSLFLEKAVNKIVAKKGYVSFIIKSVVHSNLSFSALRNLILNNKWLIEVCYTGDKVFIGPNVDTTILVCKKDENKQMVLKNAIDFKNHRERIVPSNYFHDKNNIISVDVDSNIGDIVYKKVFNDKLIPFTRYYDIFQGIITGNNPAYIFETEKDALDKGIDNELLHTLCHGRDIGKYIVNNTNKRILYLDGSIDIECYPNTKKWLLNFKEALLKRREVIKGTIKWYELQWPRIKAEFDLKEKILLQRTRNEKLKTRIVATLDNQGVYGMEGLYFIIPKTEDANLHYLIAILNSKLINYLFATKLLNLSIKSDYIEMLGLPAVSSKQQQELAKLVDQMMAAVRKQNEAVSEQDKQVADTFVSAIDNQINQKVYELYGIGTEEIAMIEGCN